MIPKIVKRAAGKVCEGARIIPGYFAPLDRRRFGALAAELSLVLFIFLFAFMRTWTVSVYTAQELKLQINGLYLAFSIITLVAAASMLVLTELARRGRLSTAYILIAAFAQSIGFVIYFAYALSLGKGVYMCIEAIMGITYGAAAIVAVFSLLGKLDPARSAAIIFTIALAAAFSGLIPAFVGKETLIFCIMEYLPLAVMVAYFGMLIVGTDEKWIKENKVDDNA